MENQVSLEQQKPSFFKKILRKFSPQDRNQVSLQTQQKEPETPSSISRPEAITQPKEEARQQDIGTQFIGLLKQKGAIIPPKEFMSVGVSATLGYTNEKVDANLIEKVRSQEHPPNGYLIGIGAGNVFRMLELYPEGKTPKAIILFDIDPLVVAQGQYFIEQLKRNKPEDDGNLEPLKSIIKKAKERRKLAPVLQQLAQEGNLVIAQADFTDERVIEALNNLPNLRDYSNVIYLSNISDHIWRRKYSQGKYEYIPNFNFLESLTPKSPLKNYYVDTVRQSLSYNLRIDTRVPQFDYEDFIVRSGNPLKLSPLKPRDQIE